MYKLSPLFPHDPSVTFNDFKAPSAILEYDVIAEHAAGSTEVGSDWAPLLVGNTGGS